MPYLPQQNTIVQYYANGIQTEYTVPFYTPIEPDGTPDLLVYTQLSTAAPIPQIDLNEWNVAYIYTPDPINPLTGGKITFNSGYIPANGYIVTIVRNVSASLDAEFANAQNFSGITLDAALDKLLLISQQNKSYALQRNLSYIVNSYLPESELLANVQIPVLPSGYIWMGSASGGVAAVYLQQPADASTLRSELANQQPVTDGAGLVGYYDSINTNTTTVNAQLTLLTTAAQAAVPSGTIIDFAGTSAPIGFLACDGASYLAATYPNLFTAIGYTWGGSGANFNVPDLSRSVTMGSGGTGTAVIGNAVGNTYAGETTSLSDPGQLPSHTHAATTITNTVVSGANLVAGALNNPVFGVSNVISKTYTGTSTTTIASTGNGDPFNIIQTSAIVLKCIKT